jgi:hypothetical protein
MLFALGFIAEFMIGGVKAMPWEVLGWPMRHRMKLSAR